MNIDYKMIERGLAREHKSFLIGDEDVKQDIALEMWSRRHTFDSDKHSIDNLIQFCIRNVVRSYYRSDSKQIRMNAQHVEFEERDYQKPNGFEDKVLISRLIDDMPDVVANYLYTGNMNETAKDLNMKVFTVRNQIKKYREQTKALS